MAFTEQEIRNAHIRVRAKKFALQLHTEGWAELIPNEDVEFCTDDEMTTTYKQTLIAKRCKQRAIDGKWEAIR